jgi:crooked neck
LDDDSFEEYVDYVFPADDERAANLAKLLANAQNWKRAQAAQAAQAAGGENGNAADGGGE